MKPFSYHIFRFSKRSHRLQQQQQQPARSIVQDIRDSEEGGILPRPATFQVEGNRPGDNARNISVEDSTVVSGPSAAAEEHVVLVPQAQMVDERALERAVQEATERAVQEATAGIQRAAPIVTAEVIVDSDQNQQQPNEEEKGRAETAEEDRLLGILRFVQKHSVLSCVVFSVLLLGAVGAALGVVLSSPMPSSSSSSTTDGSNPSLTFPPQLSPTTSPSNSDTNSGTEMSEPSPIDFPSNSVTEMPESRLSPTVQTGSMPSSPPTELTEEEDCVNHMPTAVVARTPSPSDVHLGSSWTRVGSRIMGVTTGDRFGKHNALALSSNGTIVAVGAPYNDEVASSSGRVQVFRHGNHGTDQPQADDEWQPMGVALTGVAAYDKFGSSVALSANGQILAVGATEYYTDRPGYVHVFEYDTTSDNWFPVGSRIVGVAANDQFGYSVALSWDGGILAVGAIWNDDHGTNAGHVRVFSFDSNSNGNEWVQLGSTLTGVAAEDEFGSSLDLSSDGRILAVGAPNNNDNGSNSGHVRAFQFNGISKDWDQLGAAIPGVAEFDAFGGSVALSANGMALAAGAASNDDNGSGSGHVRVFDYNTSANQWTQRGSAIVGMSAGDWFGVSVALSADRNQLAAGATFRDGRATDSGHVRVFLYDENSGSTFSGQWKQVGEALTCLGGFSDYFGRSVAISADGMVVAGGADEDSVFTDVMGPGYVCVYERVVE